MGCGGRKLSPDLLSHALEIVSYIDGRDAQCPVSLAEKHGIADSVVFCPVLVRRPVHLDHKPDAVADEVEEISSEGRLSAELEAFATQGLQP